ncbi:hypothetical protein ACLOJK_012479 [Asimina triloba]
MEKAREAPTLRKELERVSGMEILPHRVRPSPSFYEGFFLRGIRVRQLHPGFIKCDFKVTPRLTDATDNLFPGVVANLVDTIGGATLVASGEPVKSWLPCTSLFYQMPKPM